MEPLDLDTVWVDGRQPGALPTRAGVYDLELRPAPNPPLRFTLGIPGGGTTAAVHPVCVILHYGGQPTRFYGRPLLEQLFRPALAALNAYFVAPESLGGTWTDPANEARVMQLLDGLCRAYPLDAARVVVAGYSLGAIGCWHLLEHYPERFAAAIPVAGLPSAAVSSTIPVFTLATPTDEIFPYAGFEELVAARRAAGQPIEFARVDAHGHYDIQGFAPALGPVAAWLKRLWQ